MPADRSHLQELEAKPTNNKEENGGRRRRTELLYDTTERRRRKNPIPPCRFHSSSHLFLDGAELDLAAAVSLRDGHQHGPPAPSHQQAPQPAGAEPPAPSPRAAAARIRAGTARPPVVFSVILVVVAAAVAAAPTFAATGLRGRDEQIPQRAAVSTAEERLPVVLLPRGRQRLCPGPGPAAAAAQEAAQAAAAPGAGGGGPGAAQDPSAAQAVPRAGSPRVARRRAARRARRPRRAPRRQQLEPLRQRRHCGCGRLPLTLSFCACRNGRPRWGLMLLGWRGVACACAFDGMGWEGAAEMMAQL